MAFWNVKRIVLPLVLAFAVLTPISAQAQQAPCQFILGFQTLHDLAPLDIGDCSDNQSFASNGDAQQHTTKGLMAWRKADNWTAFTNGYQTWLNGPPGLVKRLNTERFTWEGDFGAPGTTSASSPGTASATPAIPAVPAVASTGSGPATPAVPATPAQSPSNGCTTNAPPPGYTINSACQLVTPSGNLSQEAPPSATIPSGATGKCNDGTYSFAAHHQGMCSSHGGVAQFYS